MGGEREGRGTPQEGNLTQRRREAESAEWKIDTREPVTFQDVSCRHESPAWIACQPHAPLNPMNLCALCLSAPLRESKTTTRETPDSGVAADASSIWYNAANGRRCKAAARRTPQEWNLTQRRGEAENAERKVETMTGNEMADDISKRILSP